MYINDIEKSHENYIIIVTNTTRRVVYGKWHIYKNKEVNRIG